MFPLILILECSAERMGERLPQRTWDENEQQWSGFAHHLRPTYAEANVGYRPVRYRFDIGSRFGSGSLRVPYLFLVYSLNQK